MEQIKIDIDKTIDTKLSEDVTIRRCDEISSDKIKK